jgi:peptidyl-prolyl cis-trans isomerase C
MVSFRARSIRAFAVALMCGTALLSVPASAQSATDPVVADVDGVKVLRSEVLDQLQAMDPQIRQLDPKTVFPQLLDRSVMRTVVTNAAAKAEIDKTPAFKARMDALKRDVMLEVYLQEAVKERMTDERLQAAYQAYSAANPPQPQVHAAHILVSDEDLAKEIITKLNAGGSFADLAKEHGKDSTRTNGGDLGWFSEGDMVPEFSRAAFAMEPGSYSKEPVKSQFGWHVIQVQDRRMSAPASLEDVRSELEGQVSQDILRQLVGDLRDAATIETFDYDGNKAQ